MDQGLTKQFNESVKGEHDERNSSDVQNTPIEGIYENHNFDKIYDAQGS